MITFAEITPEQTANLIQGATPVQIVTLVFVGVLCCCFFFMIVKWFLDLRIGTLPEDIKEIKNKLNENAIAMSEMKQKLWSEDKIKKEMSGEITQHQMECPAWQYHCKLNQKEN